MTKGTKWGFASIKPKTLEIRFVLQSERKKLSRWEFFAIESSCD